MNPSHKIHTSSNNGKVVLKVNIDVSDIDPRAFSMDDVFIRVTKEYQKEQLGDYDDDWDDD